MSTPKIQPIPLAIKSKASKFRDKVKNSCKSSSIKLKKNEPKTLIRKALRYKNLETFCLFRPIDQKRLNKVYITKCTILSAPSNLKSTKSKSELGAKLSIITRIVHKILGKIKRNI